MKIISFKILVLWLPLISHCVMANEEKTKEQLALEYLTLTKTIENIRRDIEISVEEVAAEGNAISSEQIKVIMKFVTESKAFNDPLTKIISDSFTVAELREINEFYKTGSGVALVTKTPNIELEIRKEISKNLQELMSHLLVEN